MFKFEKDSYYKIILYSGIVFYIRFSHSSISFIYDYFWFIIYDGEYKYHERIKMVDYNAILKSNIKSYDKIMLDDIVEYLPLKHPDRIEYRKNRIQKLLNYAL